MSQFRNFCQFWDASCLMTGGRLDCSSVSYSLNYTVILQSRFRNTKLIISHEHQHQIHTTQPLLPLLNQKCWIPNGRNTVHQRIHRGTTSFSVCGTCSSFYQQQTCLRSLLHSHHIKTKMNSINMLYTYNQCKITWLPTMHSVIFIWSFNLSNPNVVFNSIKSLD
jgi:hypothetical protein